MNDRPNYVQNALSDWTTIALFAYEYFEKAGRIAIGIEADPEDPDGAKLSAIQHDYENGKPDLNTAKNLADYDPESEIIIQYIKDEGRIKTERLNPSSGAHHPKRIYFFEILRRLSEETSTVNLSELPKWLIEALEGLAGSRETK